MKSFFIKMLMHSMLALVSSHQLATDKPSQPQSPLHHRANANKHSCQISGRTVNCTNRSLKSVPDDLPLDLTILDISHNAIEILDGNLSMYKNLLELYAGSNNISKLQDDCFRELHNLVRLDLHDNILTMNMLTKDVFKPLKSLRTLKMNKNNPKNLDYLSYPDSALSELTNLTHLHMDGLRNRTFGIGFSNMTSLQTLIIKGHPTGYCYTEALSEDIFIHLTQLTELKMTSCFLNGSLIHSNSLAPLRNLQYLDLSNNNLIHFAQLGPALAAMKSNNLTHLKIRSIRSRYLACGVVKSWFANSLPRSLTFIDASNNGLTQADPEVFDRLPRNLKYLDLSNNRFIFGTYLTNMHKLQNLKKLRLDGADGDYSTELWKPLRASKIRSPRTKAAMTSFQTPALFQLPPKLKTLSMRSTSMSFTPSEIHFDPNNSLENLFLDGNKFWNLVGPVTGLNKLKRLSAVDSFIRVINHTFFNSFSSLIFLNLSANTFGGFSLKDGQPPLFRNLSKLQVLDVSFVDITTMEKNTFEGLNNLEFLYIQQNVFYYFFVDISHMPKLKFIDFSQTELSYLPTYVTDSLDLIARNHSLVIDFSINPIHCYCANFDFVKWITQAMKVIQFKKANRMKCVYEDTSEKFVSDFEQVLLDLVKQCIPKFTMFVIVTALTLIMVILIVALVVYRFRWKLKYLYYSAYLYFKNNKRGEEYGHVFPYDVFVSYASEDEGFVFETLAPELQSRGLKLHIHTTDFRAGEFITTNIVNAVQQSRKTLILLTQHLLSSVWCKFEVQMANMESVHTGRSVMVFLLMGRLSLEKMDTELLYHIKSNTYVQLPHDLMDDRSMDVFWAKLCSDLQN